MGQFCPYKFSQGRCECTHSLLFWIGCCDGPVLYTECFGERVILETPPREKGQRVGALL
jgi:hypothetical protein